MCKNQRNKTQAVIICIILCIAPLFISINAENASAWSFGGLDTPRTSVDYLVGDTPSALFVEDVNSDGIPDIITANENDNTVSVLLGDGAGTFIEADSSPVDVGNNPRDVYVADVNGNHMDIIVVNAFDDNVTLLFGDGSGNFSSQSSRNFSVGDEPKSVFVADINGEHADLIVANTKDDNVTVLLGDGNGDFQEAENSPFSVGDEPKKVYVADVDGGHSDIITSNWKEKSISILSGDGTGNFSDTNNGPENLRYLPEDLAISDIDDDGYVDILVTYFAGSDYLDIYYGDETGEYSGQPQSIEIEKNPRSVDTLDVNGDTHIDIITSNQGSNDVSVFLGDGERNFSEVLTGPYPVGDRPTSLFMADLNKDGIPDIITANENSDDVSVLLGRGNGYFFTTQKDRLGFIPLPREYPFWAEEYPTDVVVGDLNDDDLPDIITANDGANSISIFLMDSNGDLPSFPANINVGANPTRVVLADVDGDTVPDILTVNRGSNDVSVLLGQGDGSFLHADNSPFDVGQDPRGVFVAKMNSDAYADIVTCNYADDNVSVLLGNGKGDFANYSSSSLTVGEKPKSLYVGDINADSNQDIVTANEGTNDLSFLLGDGTGNFSQTTNSPHGMASSPGDLQLADIDDDDNLDIITVMWGTDHVVILKGDGTGNFTEFLDSPFSVGDGPWKVFTSDLNSDNCLDILTLNQLGDDVTVLIGDGTGDFMEALKSPFAVSPEPRGLCVANVTGDFLPDVITTNYNDLDNLHIHETIIDFDFDGVPDEYDELPTNPTEWRDFDHDLIGNNSDPDDDNDEFPDMIDAFPLNRSEWNDTDGDEIGDNSDEDIDGDGVNNILDLFPYDRYETDDTDGDGIGDNSDPDIDDDGHINIQDVFPFDRTDWADNDEDGIGDNADDDDDNDQYPDLTDAFPRNKDEWNDTDGDGDGDNHDLDIDNDLFLNIFDDFPFLATEWNDLDGDGIGDNTDLDRDGDGVENSLDVFPNDMNESSDLDGDHFGDNVDWDIDGDSVPNSQDAFPFDGTEWMDLDGDGIGNNTDPDMDGDTVLNEDDVFPEDFEESADLDGDHIGDNADEDIDGDEVDNGIDAFPRDGTEWSDIDGDGTGDNADEDKDGDGHPDNDDAYPWDESRWEEEEDFFGWTMNIGQYNKWMVRLFYSTLFFTLYSLGSTIAILMTNRHFFLSPLYFVKRSRKVPHYTKEIERANSVPDLDTIFHKVEDDRNRRRLNNTQYTTLRQAAEQRRVMLTYAVLGSLTHEQQFRIFNDIIMKDEATRSQWKDAVDTGREGEESREAVDSGDQKTVGMKEQGEPPAETNALVAGAMVTKSADISNKNIDNVHFTVTAPPRVTPKSTFVVDLWAHLDEQQKKVIEQAHLMAESEDLTIRSVGPKPISRGTTLEAKLRIEDMEIAYPAQTILWEGEIGNANYPVKVPKGTEIGSKQGMATIHIDGLMIAMINFVIQVIEDSGTGSVADVESGERTGSASVAGVECLPTDEKRIETAFASYARKDRDLVLPRIQGLQKALPSLSIFMDIISLRSGQNWEKEIMSIIPAKDVFYLFWSENARNSHWVEVEWRCALETKGIDFIDPIPLVSPEIVPPPPELGTKHFDDWTLSFMRNENLNRMDKE